ncbi:alpha/beta hydrolase [Azohydromonas caseinilytica]|uniref:Alpha/beta hydrolase n=1 Tax=Azohydromonas caseinilytica TaxID=2728836 RepID=A0A848FJ86_9BURK|nr:alpha/beta fold hydrolase [Azohydromonas caseinilytica]NML18369.1 alpha/beta hydrolase [Azohydromonas caseinilytica]
MASRAFPGRLVTTLLLLAVVALLFLAAIYRWQDRLLYIPDRAPVERLAVDGLRAWPSAQDFRGLVAEPAGTVRGTVVVFHGNAGHAGHRAFFAQALVPQGWRVILAEHPGYGPRGGAPGEASLVADAQATLARAHEAFAGPLLVVGESLGAAVAAGAAAGRRDIVAGLLLITPWDRLAHVASLHYPWLPVRWLLRDGYDSVAYLAGFGRPVVVAVAEHDRIVPARLGRALYAALEGPKRLLVIEGGGHNDWPERLDAAWWREALGAALDEAAR